MLRYDRVAAYRGGDVLRLLIKGVVDSNSCGIRDAAHGNCVAWKLLCE